MASDSPRPVSRSVNLFTKRIRQVQIRSDLPNAVTLPVERKVFWLTFGFVGLVADTRSATVVGTRGDDPDSRV